MSEPSESVFMDSFRDRVWSDVSLMDRFVVYDGEKSMIIDEIISFDGS